MDTLLGGCSCTRIKGERDVVVSKTYRQTLIVEYREMFSDNDVFGQFRAIHDD